MVEKELAMKKNIILPLLVLIAALILTGCVNNEPVADEEGNRLYITGEEMGLEGTGREGIFVMNEDGTFSPVINEFEGYQGETSESSPERYIWFTNNSTNLSDLIPTVGKNAPLVMIYDSDESMPASFTLERYVFRGYTIGCHIYRGPDNSLYFSTDGTLNSSYAGNTMSQVKEGTEFKISTINGSDALPYENVDNNMQMILGLEKNKYYDFEFYQGTKYRKLTTVADTLVLQSSEVIKLNNPYSKTKEGYFLINLPDNLEEGYYYICGKGLFKYVP